MNKQELIRRLTALLSAMGVLSGGLAVAGELGEADEPAVEEACADTEAKKPKYPSYPRPLYGVTTDVWFKSGDLDKVEHALNEADQALLWAETAEGREAVAGDAKLREIIENLKTNVPAIKRRLTEVKKASQMEAR